MNDAKLDDARMNGAMLDDAMLVDAKLNAAKLNDAKLNDAKLDGAKLISSVSHQRRAGVLLHPTSLPGNLDSGDIGHQAYRFIEFLQASGFKVWQMLPLGMTHEDKSPYQCLSSHAGDPLLISLDWLEDRGWLKQDTITYCGDSDTHRMICLQTASDYFYKNENSQWLTKLQDFKKKHKHWLEDYSLFIALKTQYKNSPWYEWPADLRHRENKSIKSAISKLEIQLNQVVFEQFVFFTQWHEIRDYAKQHGIELFGDVPIFVARDSADVWAERQNFLMNSDGDMEFIAGVPPDAFSETGQRWGNPLYDWEYLQSTEFSWWKERFKTQLELFDMVRIDHFRGLQACWNIPDIDDTAINGKWEEVPGKEMLTTLFSTFRDLPLIAEDLGVITDEVVELKNEFSLPGIKVLQFAFDGNNKNPHLPHNHHPDDLIYTGTHDNDTTLGWIKTVENYNKNFFQTYVDKHTESNEKSVIEIIRLAMSSVSFLCILPMQDLLLLDTEHRMNIPGTVGGNWMWRFDWKQIKPEVLDRVKIFMSIYQR